MTEVEHEVAPEIETPDEEAPITEEQVEEAERDDDAPLEESLPEVPAQPEPETKADRELQKKVAQAATTYRTRISLLLGEEAQALVPCELCAEGILGSHFPPEWLKPESEIEARLIEVLKAPLAPEYQAASSVRTCGDCGGWGKVASGSKVAGKETITCPACKGYGYSPPPAPSTNGYASAADLPPEIGVTTAAAVVEDKDVWGSPRHLPDGQENPNYGKMVQYKDPNLP